MGDITKNFSYEEFKVSAQFPALAEGIELTKLDKYKLFLFSNIFLQPIRDIINSSVESDILKTPITPTSGIRSVELNEKVGGVEISDHLFRRNSIAVDFVIGTRDKNFTKKYLDIVYRECRRKKHLVNQFIYYYDGNFVHLSMIDGGGKVWDRWYCARRPDNVSGRKYFRSPTDAESYLRLQ